MYIYQNLMILFVCECTTCGIYECFESIRDEWYTRIISMMIWVYCVYILQHSTQHGITVSAKLKTAIHVENRHIHTCSRRTYNPFIHPPYTYSQCRQGKFLSIHLVQVFLFVSSTGKYFNIDRIAVCNKPARGKVEYRRERNSDGIGRWYIMYYT